jgi:pimeloyl-ACP methyl ester carboxylesterase
LESPDGNMNAREKPDPRKRLLLSFAHALAIIGVIPAILLFWVASTPGGNCVALSLLIGLPGLVVFLRVRLKKGNVIIGRIGLAMLLSGIVLWGIALKVSPDGQTPETQKFQSVFAGEATYKRFSISNLVPEVDQFLMGNLLIPFLDPYMDYDQGARMRGLLHRIYDPMREDPEFLRAGSVMNYVYRDSFTGGGKSDHYYLYLPETSDDPLRTLLFLHGSMGNFKGYLWVLKKFADATGCAVIAPDNGFGNWRDAETRETLDLMITTITNHPRLDENRMMLAGLSNGGIGATKMATYSPERWESITLISPVLPFAFTEKQHEVFVQEQTPIHIISGDIDRRIPAEYLVQRQAKLQSRGLNVSYEEVEGEDHFLMFSQPDRVVEALKLQLTSRIPAESL